MRIVVASRFFKTFIHPTYRAFAFYPWVFVRSADLSSNSQIVRHEQIHLAQQRELGIVLFYPIYVMEFLLRLIQTRRGYTAYRTISFEREAYGHDHEPDYLNERKWCAMWRR